MQRSFCAVLQAILFAMLGILWCEVGYYYYMFVFSCPGWPEPSSASGQNFTRILIVSDTHIMGPIKSVKIDKIRREWQMKQAFSISNSIFRPDLIVFLGDILDEASFSGDELFNFASEDFSRIFSYNEQNQQRLIIPGNHDIGFHKQMLSFPYLIQRFHRKYDATANVQLYRFSGVNIIASNSMSLFNDSCPFCAISVAQINQLANQLDKQGLTNEFSRPILLTHIPLFRENDLQCVYPSSLANVVRKNNIEGEDVLHSATSKFILQRLRPRLILSGHTHMDCLTRHQIPGAENEFVEEITVSSYNHKFAELKPTFLLLSVNSTHIFKQHCNMVEEWIIVSVYVATVVLVCTRLAFLYKSSSELKSKTSIAH